MPPKSGNGPWWGPSFVKQGTLIADEQLLALGDLKVSGASVRGQTEAYLSGSSRIAEVELMARLKPCP